MLMILKTFKLSKSLVYLLYVLLIITTVISIDIKDEQANPSKTDDENNNPDKDIQGDSNLITSNINSPAENDRSIKNNVLQGIFSRMSNWNNKPSQIKSSETNIVKNQQPELYNENDPTEITLGLSSEPETNGVTGLEEVSDKIIDDKETKKTKKKKKKKNKKQKKTEDIETKSKLNVMNTNGDELSIVGSEEKNIRRLDNIKYQQPELYEENDPTKMTLDLSHDLTSTEKDVELDNKKTKTNSQKEETDLISAESKAIGSDNIKSTIEQISKLSDPEKNPIDDIVKDTEKTTMMGVDQKDLTLSPLEDVGIIKIKNSENATSEAIRKEKKKTKFIEFTHSGGSARIYCTFLGDVLKMYNKVKKRFVGHFCHAIVIGTPIILKQNQIHLSDNMKNHLNKIEPYKQGSLLIVIMKFSNYKDWKKTLANNVNIKHLVANIIHMVKTYKIDGIEFSNLQPIVGEDTVDTHMMNNLLKFFKKLLNVARHNHNHNLKIGITIHLNSQWITPSFTSFDQLNKMVTWYAYETISMVTCSSEYKDAGTSPLIGDVSLTNAYNTLAKTEIEMAKVVVGIQLFPNKVNELEPLTYEELCSTPKDSWDEWCAAHPEKLRLKGIFLRNNEIGGVQLFYMHSDDYRSTCGCYSFPLTRALLRGLINTQTEEQCDFNTAHN